MTSIVIVHRKNVLNDDSAMELRKTLIDSCSERFETASFPEAGDVDSVLFHEIGNWDSMDADVSVSITQEKNVEHTLPVILYACHLMADVAEYFNVARELIVEVRVIFTESGVTHAKLRVGHPSH